MITTTQRARKVGGSLMVLLPKDVAEHEGLHPDDMVEIQVRPVRKDWLGALKGIPPIQKEDKLDIKDY